MGTPADGTQVVYDYIALVRRGVYYKIHFHTSGIDLNVKRRNIINIKNPGEIK